MLLLVVLALAVAAGVLMILILRASRDPELESLRKARLALTAENPNSEPMSELRHSPESMTGQGGLESKTAPLCGQWE